MLKNILNKIYKRNAILIDENCSKYKANPRVGQFQKQKRLKKVVSKILSIAAGAIGFCLLYLCLSNLYQQVFNPYGYTGFFGIGEAVVASDSMKPELYPNDLVFYKSADINDVEKGDTIVYRKENSNGDTVLVIHEIIQIDDGYVTTQGINNDVPDDPFSTSNIVGKYMFKIGQIGVILSLLSTPWAPVVIIVIMMAIFAIRIFAYIWNKKRVLNQISQNSDTRSAIDHFFEI